MTTFTLQTWDEGRLIVNLDHAARLWNARLATFDALWNHAGGTVAKNLLKERTTTRIEVTDTQGESHAYFLKRHTRPPFKEYLKPLLRLTWPILGARPEWDAILRFHAAGIPTMTPVALGQSHGNSFLLTAAIEGCRKLSHVMDELRVDAAHTQPPRPAGLLPRRAERPAFASTVRQSIARSARTMHAHGLHHQDFYLGHLMIPASGKPDPLYVIDLGRVQHQKRLAQRWVVKDLAQLNYSAHGATRAERLRFMSEYLDRPLTEADRPLIRRIATKTERIARHSKKNRL